MKSMQEKMHKQDKKNLINEIKTPLIADISATLIALIAGFYFSHLVIGKIVMFICLFAITNLSVKIGDIIKDYLY